MRDPKQFPDPEVFLPERWLRGCPQQNKAHPLASASFGHGPRMCVGRLANILYLHPFRIFIQPDNMTRRFAELELYILMIKILQRVRLEHHGTAIKMVTAFVNKPDKKIRMRLVKRN